MKSRIGLTLMELVITMVLLTILISSLYRLNSNRIVTLQAINDNTIALFAAESSKNRALLELESPGAVQTLPAVFPDEGWLIRSSSQGQIVKIALQKAGVKNPRIFHTEVILNEK